jgi:DNA topoisomerase VI subunit A
MMAEIPLDKVDIEARKKAAKILYEKFKKVLDDILKGIPPKLEIPKRTLANTIFDRKKGILVLGDQKLEREFLDMGEARRFMQTLLMASIIYQALIENEYPTIRDLYYRGKHTIIYKDPSGKLRQENTWDEQAESDAVIRDIEVFTGLLREDMLILSKEKGKVVGNLKIRSGGDVIDLSKMGHGAYAIESTPDLIEFLDWDAEFVLVVEKDAVFQQLHRVGFWRKYKAILVTGAGQPDRATRRFVRRLNEELKLPVYVLTDSIPEDEVVIARDLISKEVIVGPIGEMVSKFFTEGLEREWTLVPLEVPSLDIRTRKIMWKPVFYAYRHWIEDKLLEIETDKRGIIRVTKSHSLFVIRNGMISAVPADKIRPGDKIVVARRMPMPISSFASLNKLKILKSLNVKELTSLIEELNNNINLNGASREHICLTNDEVKAKEIANLLLMYNVDVNVSEKDGETCLTPIKGSRSFYNIGSRVSESLSDVTEATVVNVHAIEYEGYVYDFAVDINNSFVGGHGIVYHNSDPYGFYIYSVYKVGSIQLSYESERLATPSAKFLGVSMTDIFGWRGKKPYLTERERRNYIIKATEADIKRAKELMRYSWFQTPGWQRELKIFLEKKAKLEIEALASKGLRFLAFEYIPQKLETGDWIE